jgi:hypothetical protein
MRRFLTPWRSDNNAEAWLSTIAGIRDSPTSTSRTNHRMKGNQRMYPQHAVGKRSVRTAYRSIEKSFDFEAPRHSSTTSLSTRDHWRSYQTLEHLDLKNKQSTRYRVGTTKNPEYHRVRTRLSAIELNCLLGARLRRG